MNIKDFDLNLLVVFDAVLGEGSISRAAARLDLSQPAVSNALARLRKATGDRLFVRLGNGVAPTPYAESIAAPIRAALAAIGASLAGRQEFDAATSQRDFAIHITDLGEAYFLPRLLRASTAARRTCACATSPCPPTRRASPCATHGGPDHRQPAGFPRPASTSSGCSATATSASSAATTRA
ncbi:MAG: LysR family transcriptional regulator [Betaproteobacteria bacterium]|nr:LysR family transcriptional regulator [Betaproteobacteria bacterium]